jgi:hypothetical protein
MGQSVHATSPNVAEYLPTTQCTQEELPTEDENFPGVYAVQTFHPCSEYSPTEQLKHIPFTICWPDAQQHGINVTEMFLLSLAV